MSGSFKFIYWLIFTRHWIDNDMMLCYIDLCALYFYRKIWPPLVRHNGRVQEGKMYIRMSVQKYINMRVVRGGNSYLYITTCWMIGFTSVIKLVSFYKLLCYYENTHTHTQWYKRPIQTQIHDMVRARRTIWGWMVS